jgi:hypothetical protein
MSGSQMRQWIKERWPEARGNFYGGVLAAAFIGLVAAVWSLFNGFWPWAWARYTSMQLPARVLGPLLVITTSTSIVLLADRRRLKAAIARKQCQEGSFENMLEGVRLEREAATTMLAARAKDDENSLGPITAEIADRMMKEDLMLEAIEEPLGISVWLHNNGVVPVHNIKLQLTALTTFHKGKGQFRTANSELVTYLSGRALQPDEKSEAHRVAYLSHTEKIELSLPEKSYVPNPETRPQIFRATYQISADDEIRSHEIYFTWMPRENPRLINQSEIEAV